MRYIQEILEEGNGGLIVLRLAVHAEDNLAKRQFRGEVHELQSSLVRTVLDADEHPRFLLIAPALMLRAQEPVHKGLVDFLRPSNLDDVRLVMDLQRVRAVVGDIEPKADSCMAVAVMAPEQQIVPVAAEAQQATICPEVHDVLIEEGIYAGVSCIDRVEIERVVEVVDGGYLQPTML